MPKEGAREKGYLYITDTGGDAPAGWYFEMPLLVVGQDDKNDYGGMGEHPVPKTPLPAGLQWTAGTEEAATEEGTGGAQTGAETQPSLEEQAAALYEKVTGQAWPPTKSEDITDANGKITGKTQTPDPDAFAKWISIAKTLAPETPKAPDTQDILDAAYAKVANSTTQEEYDANLADYNALLEIKKGLQPTQTIEELGDGSTWVLTDGVPVRKIFGAPTALSTQDIEAAALAKYVNATTPEAKAAALAEYNQILEAEKGLQPTEKMETQTDGSVWVTENGIPTRKVINAPPEPNVDDMIASELAKKTPEGWARAKELYDFQNQMTEAQRVAAQQAATQQALEIGQSPGDWWTYYSRLYGNQPSVAFQGPGGRAIQGYGGGTISQAQYDAVRNQALGGGTIDQQTGLPYMGGQTKPAFGADSQAMDAYQASLDRQRNLRGADNLTLEERIRRDAGLDKPAFGANFQAMDTYQRQLDAQRNQRGADGLTLEERIRQQAGLQNLNGTNNNFPVLGTNQGMATPNQGTAAQTTLSTLGTQTPNTPMTKDQVLAALKSGSMTSQQGIEAIRQGMIAAGWDAQGAASTASDIVGQWGKAGVIGNVQSLSTGGNTTQLQSLGQSQPQWVTDPTNPNMIGIKDPSTGTMQWVNKQDTGSVQMAWNKAVGWNATGTTLGGNTTGPQWPSQGLAQVAGGGQVSGQRLMTTLGAPTFLSPQAEKGLAPSEQAIYNSEVQNQGFYLPDYLAQKRKQMGGFGGETAGGGVRSLGSAYMSPRRLG